jgi:hypothetical protein
MGNNNAEVNFQIRLSVDRRRVEDRRFFLRHEDFNLDSGIRGNMIKRRILGDRRRLLPEIMNTFWKEAE